MSTTARISNVSSETTSEQLVEHFRSKDIPVTLGQTRVSLVAGPDGLQTAVLTFDNEAGLQKARSLSSQDRQLNGRQINLDNGFDGFTALSDGNEVDMVALHGLNGHAFTTWEYREGDDHFMWLRDSLPEHIPGARILTYGYNANVISDVSIGRLRTFAETFLENLRLERSSEKHRGKPLLIMAHSLGGLVVKQALIVANNRADGRYQDIVDSIRAIVFFGTPHRGGNGVNAAKFVADLLKAINIETRGDLLKTLDPRSLALFDLTDDFRQVVELLGITIHTFFEGKKTKVGHWPAKRNVLIVQEDSAILGTAKERKALINADHSHLCKFIGPSDSSYMIVRNVTQELITLITPIVTFRSVSTQPSAPPDLKYTNLTDPDQLGGESAKYPVLEWGGYTYWALSHLDNRYGMVILAYDGQGRIVQRWEKVGAHYVHSIKVEYGRVEFIGQGRLSVSLNLKELRIQP